jgi:AraC-like DNA-binding protein
MELSIADVITILVFFQSSLFSFYLLSMGKSKKISNRLIACFIFLLGINVFDNVLTKSVYLDFPKIAFIIYSSSPLIAPLIYLYIKSIAFKDFRLKKEDIFHFLFFGLIFSWAFYSNYFQNDTNEFLIFRKSITEPNLQDSIFALVLHLQTLFYFNASFKVISRYKKIVKENFSDADKINLTWLKEITLAFMIVITLSSIELIIQYFSNHRSYFNTLPFIFSAYLFFVNWIIYKALKVPQIFAGINLGIPLVEEMKLEIQEEQNTTLPNDGISPTKELLIKLNKLIEHEKPYRNSTLSLKELAESLEVSTRDISLLINNELNQNFFDFINRYRINEAKELLGNPENKKVTILEIMYDVGFNSKSSFNTAFKKYTNKTPSQFRKEVL